MIAVTLLHGRPGITRLFALHMQDIGLPWVAAVTPDARECVEIAEEFAVEYVLHPDRRLAWKWNAAMELARGRGSAVILGSDDLVAREWLDHLAGREFDWAMPTSTAFYDTDTGRACLLSKRNVNRVTGLPPRFGAGRVVAERVVPHCRWNSGLRRGLDGDNYRVLRAAGFKETEFDFAKPPVVDLKSPDNRWPFEHLASRSDACTAEDALWMVSPTVREAFASTPGCCPLPSGTSS